jgi:PAS domain S-box-containing protein
MRPPGTRGAIVAPGTGIALSPPYAPPPMIATAHTFARTPLAPAPQLRRQGFDLEAPPHLLDAPLLLVDDDPAVLATLRLLVKRAGYRGGVAAGSGAVALDAAALSPPDIVLLDLWMPGLDGFEVMRRLRDAEATRDVPILVLSGDERSEVKRDALSAGATDFLSKPFDPVEALLRIRNLLEMRFLHRMSLRESLTRYEELVESASDAIYEADVRGRVTYLNPAAARMLGDEGAELEGMEIADLVPEEHREAARRELDRQLREGIPATVLTLPVRAADGTERWLEHNLRLATRAGEVTGLRAIARDVTERQKLEAIKDQLIANVSHELRTPLTAISASLGLLRSGRLDAYPERTAAMVDLASRNAERLIRLVNDSLDVERMARAALSLERVSYPLRALLSEAVDTVRSLAERAGIFVVVTAPDLEWSLDPGHLHRVLVNLLGNALKFSEPDGTVWISAEMRGGELEISVRDRGRGIPAEKLEAIFGRFEQVQTSDAREKGGSGLGLAICRGLVELHGGRIWAESAPGSGSTFRVVLP